MIANRLIALFGLCIAASALPHQSPFSSISKAITDGGKEIETWALNPTGDAAVIRVKNRLQHELHLLAINAQYSVPSSYHGSANPNALYSFLDDQTFLSVSPTVEQDIWEVTTQELNYTVNPPAYPPSATSPVSIGKLSLTAAVELLVYSVQAGVLTLVTSRNGLILLNVVKRGDEWIVAGEPRSVKHDNLIYLLNLQGSRSSSQLLYQTHNGPLTSPVFGANNHIAWLSDDRKLWLSTGRDQREVPLNFDLSPKRIIFSKDGKAIYLLAPHNIQQSLFHLWTPSVSDTKPIEPVRIPSNGTIHSAIHVGITPLDHAHLIGVKSDQQRGEGKELWVISHSPHEDPTYNYENIRLTYFT
ncbi:hypothetical protein I302_103247 [Kwoniella bestiolae CBS 10118]|uniref:Uncharacterized protein n=1 Tax=Kwoniella bestiolae CBS 10118 TaxID=1296100 RepID=A0A1B9G7Y5_9TREE|nr:hypothetical protein I302_01946 [Kwoniella bestiolae CBS 10118]OCF27111.1 hypothetical protein I302_01946 [Kwoniella bestiolae CBS 10118]